MTTYDQLMGDQGPEQRAADDFGAFLAQSLGQGRQVDPAPDTLPDVPPVAQPRADNLDLGVRGQPPRKPDDPATEFARFLQRELH